MSQHYKFVSTSSGRLNNATDAKAAGKFPLPEEFRLEVKPYFLSSATKTGFDIKWTTSL
jgi:hypothetical protein